jgi:hypothetical protein
MIPIPSLLRGVASTYLDSVAAYASLAPDASEADTVTGWVNLHQGCFYALRDFRQIVETNPLRPLFTGYFSKDMEPWARSTLASDESQFAAWETVLRLAAIPLRSSLAWNIVIASTGVEDMRRDPFHPLVASLLAHTDWASGDLRDVLKPWTNP